jgi:hypothetical protein
MAELAAKACVPCRGDVPPMPKDEAEDILRFYEELETMLGGANDD